MSAQALVLNASFEPLHIVSWQRALQLLFQGKVEVVEDSETQIRTVRFSMKVPAVLRLLTYVPLMQRRRLIRFSRTNVFIRDDYTCQYCGKHHHKTHLTLDHVVPVVQGGKKNWTNIVTSCKRCNQNKGGRTPKQAGMRLARPPREPRWLPKTHIEFEVTIVPEIWKNYLNAQL